MCFEENLVVRTGLDDHFAVSFFYAILKCWFLDITEPKSKVDFIMSKIKTCQEKIPLNVRSILTKINWIDCIEIYCLNLEWKCLWFHVIVPQTTGQIGDHSNIGSICWHCNCSNFSSTNSSRNVVGVSETSIFYLSFEIQVFRNCQKVKRFQFCFVCTTPFF
jgi:hypothetical protein